MSKHIQCAAAFLALAACQPTKPAQSYGFLALLGNDTISVERVTRRGNEIVSDEVDRFPRVHLRHTTMRLAPDGSIRHLEMDIRTPSEPSNEQFRHVVADVSKDSVHITKHDSTGTKVGAFATGGALTMPHLPQMYSLTDLYFGAALRRTHAPGDSVELRQYYIDREFDRFPLHHGVVRKLAGNKADLHHDWLAGYGDEAIGERFASLETSTGGAKQLSVRDTARATIGAATFSVDYGRPLAR